MSQQLKRKGCRISVTKKLKLLNNLLKHENLSEVEADISTMKQHLQELREKMAILDEEIQCQLEENDFLKDLADADERKEEIDRGIFLASKALASIISDSKSQDSQSSHTCLNRSPVFKAKLPTIELLSFDGNPLSWSTFWDNFKSAIHSRNDVPKSQKFSYLRGQLKGEAKQLLDGFPTEDIYYDEAVALLVKTYGKKYLIIRAHLHSILDLECPNSNSRDLRKFMAQYECHLRSLKALDVDVDSAGHLYAAILLRKLPFKVRDNITRAVDVDTWTLPKLRESVEKEIEYLADTKELSNVNNHVDRKPQQPQYSKSKYDKSTIGSFPIGQPYICQLCSGPHKPSNCTKYTTPQERQQIVHQLKLCQNCLRNNHFVSDCRIEINCFVCNKRHHTSLCNKTVMSNQLLTSEQEHMEFKSNANRKAKEKNKSQKSKSPHSENSVVAVTRSRSDQTVALPLAMLPIRCSSGVQYARAMFDTGSQRSFISHKTVEELNLEVIGRDCLAIKGFVGEINENTYDVIAIPVLSKFGLIMVEALSVPQVPSPITIPGISMHVQKLRKLKIALADPYINTDEVDIAILIGSDYYFSFVNGTKVAYDTFLLTSSLGHMIGGPIPSYNVKSKIQVCNINCSPKIEEMVTNLWNLESIGIMPETPKPDDINALQSFSNNISRIDNHYITKLPWKTFRPILPTNYGLALGRLKSTIKQLEKLGEVGAYERVIQEQLQSGFIERVEYPNKKSDNIIHYIPHLPVWKKDSSTTPLRIVYDCSAGNPSLNDCLCSGPSLNNDMVKILLRFRTDKFACVADISKAYLRIGLHDSDRDATRFLWISDPNNIDSEILIYRFKVILFGATCSQFLLNATINHHLKQYENSISNYILRNIYVDNLQATANAEHELLRFYTQSKTIFEEANLFLCEWATNSALLSKTIIENRDGTKNTAKPVKILGMLWDTESDLLYYPQRDIISTNSVTKRSILSQTAQIFDPLGFITPVTVSARIFLQKLWSLKMDWDIPLSEEIISEWDIIKKKCLEVRETALLPRCVGFKGKVDIHVFCDASKYAYGAVAYLCSKEGNQFLMAKTRVAPLKALTIPRLELTAALIGARLVSFICDAYEKEFEILQTYVWSDSKVALCWIKSQKQLDPYVSNRVHEIKNLLPSASWNYVPTKQNPADLVTKGITAKQFHESIIWKTGPNWLANKEDWPSFDMAVVMDVFLPVGEEIKEIVSQSKMQPIIDLSRFNNLEKLFRVTLLVFKFISQCRSNILCIQTIDDAEKYWVSIVQGEVYENAYNSLNKKETHKPTIVKQLQLFLDGSIIRCRGRIDHSTLPWETKNPILLPSKHHFTNLVILNSHAKHHHMGVSFVVNDLRQRWWIPQIRQRVKSTIRPCVTCKRYQGSSFQTPITPPLPSHRLEEAPPFTITGIDYSGYLNVRYGNQVVKAYIALFTCAVTRAIHLELVQDNTCESFMLALRRFIGRRSCPAFIFSDNSTTFRSASDVVARMYQNDVQHYLKNQRCEWRFIPPRAPWFGGIWERLIGLTKSCLKKVLGKALVSFIELQTVIIEIEATLNDRPLTVVGSDLSDGAALTPSYLLYGHHITSLPAANVDPDLTYNEKELLTARQKKLEGIRTKFWSRFRSEYLLSLRERKLPSDNNIPLAPEVGEIVLINDDSKRHFWKLGKVLKLNKGIDGHIRSVILKTENGDICRPVSRLYPLEIRSREINDLDNLDCKQNSRCTIQRKAAIEARKRIASQL